MTGMSQPGSNVQKPLFLLLSLMLLASAGLSWWASQLSLVKLPAADVWQHTALVNAAAIGEVHLATLLEKHNQLHFIPIPKLVYALDLLWLAGNGKLVALVSATFTALCCLLFSRCIFAVPSLSKTEKTALSLLMTSWLLSILQWESFVNPANLQWSGMNAGLAMSAYGLRQRLAWLIAGTVLALGCGAPWWLLNLALLLPHCSPRALSAGATLTLFVLAAWEAGNALWWQATPPLPVLAIHVVTPFSAEQLQQLSAGFFTDPMAFYTQWLTGFLVFTGTFCMPSLQHWATLPSIMLLPFSLLAFMCLCLPQQKHDGETPLRFLVIALMLTALAAGLVRSHLPGAYTLRFANAGLLLGSSCFVLAYLSCRRHPVAKTLWYVTAALYSGLLAVSATGEAAGIVQDSNQRRLSQVAYAMDIRDMRATSETAYAPLMEQSYREINERKGILAVRGLGIYASREHRIYVGKETLPSAEIHCDYSEILSKPLRDDRSARKISGLTLRTGGQAMTSILFRDMRGHHLGYGIYRIPGRTLAEQWRQPAFWHGFARIPASGSVEIIAYDDEQRCQPFTLP